jgi:hypothetical protein
MFILFKKFLVLRYLSYDANLTVGVPQCNKPKSTYIQGRQFIIVARLIAC